MRLYWPNPTGYMSSSPAVSVFEMNKQINTPAAMAFTLDSLQDMHERGPATEAPNPKCLPINQRMKHLCLQYDYREECSAVLISS